MINQTLVFKNQVPGLERSWANDPRWKGIKRDYSAATLVKRLNKALMRADQIQTAEG